MPRTARQIDPLPEEVLKEAASTFLRCALKALENLIPNQRELADRLGWPETTLSSALQGRFTFKSWPKICQALGLDPIDALVRGRAELHKADDQAREDVLRRMLERAEADTLVAFWRRLSKEEQARVLLDMSREYGDPAPTWLSLQPGQSTTDSERDMRKTP